MFVGRDAELQRLIELSKKKTASLVVITGRRRIGKSTLAEKFGESYDNFFEFQGLAPANNISKEEQLKNFALQLKTSFDIPVPVLSDWADAFHYLASLTKSGKTLIFLDEISWMASGSPDFPGKLKVAWDTKFKKNKNIMIILCGSVSSWIDKNILNDTDFVGRISLEITLEELNLSECNEFWGSKKDYISSVEKLKILSVTGGVPKYLEEIDNKKTAEENIYNLCFRKGGMLVNEFDKIFNETFNKRAAIYQSILNILKDRKSTVQEIAEQLQKKQNGDISEYLYELDLSGFIKREYIYTYDGKKSRLSKYRIKDNYVRFYLKYIEPVKDKINSGLFEYNSLNSLSNWPVIAGFQFENLVLNNLPDVLERLNIKLASVVSASPFFQNATTNTKGACQIDLLIHTKFDTLYVCEIKFQKRIEGNVITELKEKIKVLKKPKNVSVRPVLIYAGELSEEVSFSGYFDKMVSVSELIERKR